MKNDFAPVHKVFPSPVPGKEGDPQEFKEELVLSNPLVQVCELPLSLGVKVCDALMDVKQDE